MNAMTKTKPKAGVRPSRLLGYINEPGPYFEKEKQTIRDKLGDLSDIRVPLNRILVAIWTTDDEFHSQGGILIHKPDITKDESKWQGVSALVVKMGPHAYAPNDQIAFTDDDKCKVGDWVLFRKGEGFRVEVWGHECVMLESEKAIKAVLQRPDMVF